MLLIEYLYSQGMTDRATRHPEQFRFANIKAFTFGERYLCHTYSGQVYDFDDLETILEVVATEFSVNPGHVPLISINTLAEVKDAAFGKSYRKSTRTPVSGDPEPEPAFGPRRGIGQAKDRVMCAVPALQSGAIAMPHITHFIDTMRVAVVNFNLAGSWNMIDKDNL